MTMQQVSESNPRRYTANIREKLDDVIRLAREDVVKVEEPKAQALFETTAEVLIGLRTAYEDYEQGEERAWQ
jgi:hypothetical protein